KKKMGRNSNGIILIWQLSAKNSPQRIGLSRMAARVAMVRNITIMGSVLPLKPEHINEDGLRANGSNDKVASLDSLQLPNLRTAQNVKRSRTRQVRSRR